MLAGLSVRYGEDAVERVSFQLAKGDTRSHAWPRVARRHADRNGPGRGGAARAGLTDAERFRRLTRTLPLPERSLREVLLDLVTDPERRWRQPWVQACAVHAVWSTPAVALDLA